MKITSAQVPTIVFRKGTEVVALGADGAVSAALNANVADGYVHRIYQEGNTKTHISHPEVNVWYTVIIQVPQKISSYLFGVLEDSYIPSTSTLYFRNIRFLNDLEENITSQPSGSDLALDNQAIISNMHLNK